MKAVLNKMLFAACGSLVFLGLLFAVVAQGRAWNLLWTNDNPDFGRMYAISDWVPFSIQLAIYQAGLGNWGSAEVLLPSLSILLLAAGWGFGWLESLTER